MYIHQQYPKGSVKLLSSASTDQKKKLLKTGFPCLYSGTMLITVVQPGLEPYVLHQETTGSVSPGAVQG